MNVMNLASEPIAPRTLAYHRERLRNHVFDAALRALADRVRLGQANKAIIARRLDKDPSQISRWFNGPHNWTLDTISDLMLALDAQLTLDYCLCEHLPTPNYQHPLANASNMTSCPSSIIHGVWGGTERVPTSSGDSTAAPRIVGFRIKK